MLQQLAPPQELYDDPCNLFVAGFIGSPAMNLVRAAVLREGEAVRVEFGGHRVRVPAEVLAAVPELDAHAGREVVLGIRPESFEDAALVPEAPADQRIAVAVSLRESMGAEIYVHFEVAAPPVLVEEVLEAGPEDPVAGSQADSSTSTFVARLGPQTRAREGEPIELVVDSRKLYFFNPESGKSLRSAARPPEPLSALAERSTP